MKKCTVIAIASAIMVLFCPNALAEGGPDFYVDEVAFSLSAKQWVKTNTAKVQVVINATLTNTGLVEMRNKIMTNLNRIAKGDWHITQFNRSQDSSGLEKLYVVASARVSQSLLANINVNAKKVTQPGVRYRISNVDFSPSLKEVEAVRKAVRAAIYAKAQSEVDALNQQYPKQHYSIFKLSFGSRSYGSLQRQNTPYKRKSMMLAEMPAASPAIAVSNEVKLSASVIVASNREGK